MQSIQRFMLRPWRTLRDGRSNLEINCRGRCSALSGHALSFLTFGHVSPEAYSGLSLADFMTARRFGAHRAAAALLQGCVLSFVAGAALWSTSHQNLFRVAGSALEGPRANFVADAMLCRVAR